MPAWVSPLPWWVMNDRPSEPDDDLPEQMRVRREKRGRMLERGRQPYPARFARTTRSRELRAEYADLEPGATTGAHVSPSPAG